VIDTGASDAFSAFAGAAYVTFDDVHIMTAESSAAKQRFQVFRTFMPPFFVLLENA
jgi:hypothetical protein